MESKKNPLPAANQASNIAAAFHALTAQDQGKKLHPSDEEVQKRDLDLAFDEILQSAGSRRSGSVLSATGCHSGDAGADIGGEYACPECGQVNPGENQFCGMCGAAHGEIVTVPARRITDDGAVSLHLSARNGTEHHHHHYHHDHYRSSAYLFAAVATLLAVIAWQAGWQYGTRVGAPPAKSAEAQPLPAINTTRNDPPPPSPAAEEVAAETPAASESSASDARISTQGPYPNELQGFKFYSKALAPLRPGVSRRGAVISVLGDGTKAISGWSIMPAYTTKPGSPEARLAEIVVRPAGVIPMVAVRFPAVFAHCPAVITGMDVSFDVYSDASGLEYWLYGEDSQWGSKGDLYRIAYAATKRHC